MKLRPYQQEALDCTLAKFEESNSALCVMATGLGKTIYVAHLAKHYRNLGRIMMIAHREELIYQGVNHMENICDVETDIEMGSAWATEQKLYKADIVVSTIQTQIAGRFGGRMTRFRPDEFSLLIIDEAHHAPAATYKRVIEYYRQNPTLKVVGLTATPDRHDKKAMGQIFEELAYAYDIADAIKDGWLVPIQQQSVFVKGLDYSQIRTTAGDLNGKDLADVLEYEKNLHGIADPTVELTGEKKTLVFAASVAQAERLTEIINRHKPDSAKFVYAKTPKELRRRLFNDYHRERFQYLINVGIATEGFDEPAIECIVMARPTKSRSLFCQMSGRGTRPLPDLVDNFDDAAERREAISNSGKTHLDIIDFVGNAGRHKLVTAVDILGGEYEDDVLERTRKEIADKGEAVDIGSELIRVERELEREKIIAQDAKARSHILLRAKYSIAKVNPFDVLDINPVRERSWHKDRPPSIKQTAFLNRAGVNTDGLSFTHSSQIIDVIIKNRERGKPTYKQTTQLRRSGFEPTTITFALANKIIDVIAGQSWRPLSINQKQKILQDNPTAMLA